MKDVRSAGYGVTLSDRLRSLMSTVIRTKGHSATLASVDQVLRHSSNDDLNDLLREFDDLELLPEARSLAPDRDILNREFFDVRDTWGEDYPVRLLLRAAAQGVRTHKRLCDLSVGESFQVEELTDAGTALLPTQWQRIRVGGEDLVNGRVAAQPISGNEGERSAQLLEPMTLVRPLLRPDMGFCGMVLPTPEEFHGQIYWKSQAEEAARRIEQRVREALNEASVRVYVIYAACEFDEHEVPIDNLDEVAVYGKVVFVEESDGTLAEPGSRDYQSQVVENPTWLDLCVLANGMIETTRDLDHVFLEGIDEDEIRSEQRHDGVKVYRFSMGS